jgi:hypothetical protein
MSVYCLGKLKGREEECRSFLQTAAEEAGLGISFDVDPDDKEVLEETDDLRGRGVVFTVSSAPGDSDVVRAWNSARDVGLATLKTCSVGSELPNRQTKLDNFDLPGPVRRELAGASLGKFASAVVGYEKVPAGGVAFFDGSIRQIVRGTREQCLRSILAAFLLPWDCGPDALYVWGARAEANPGADGT